MRFFSKNEQIALCVDTLHYDDHYQFEIGKKYKVLYNNIKDIEGGVYSVYIDDIDPIGLYTNREYFERYFTDITKERNIKINNILSG